MNHLGSNFELVSIEKIPRLKFMHENENLSFQLTAELKKRPKLILILFMHEF